MLRCLSLAMVLLNFLVIFQHDFKQEFHFHGNHGFIDLFKERKKKRESVCMPLMHTPLPALSKRKDSRECFLSHYRRKKRYSKSVMSLQPLT